MRRHILPILALIATYPILLANGSNFVPALVPVAICAIVYFFARNAGWERHAIVALCCALPVIALLGTVDIYWI